MQCVAYYQYLKGDRLGTCSSKKELSLRGTQCSSQITSEIKFLYAAMSNMNGAEEFCTQRPHFESEEVFLSLKRNADLPPRLDFGSHKPDKISIFRPRGQRRLTITATDNLVTSPIELQHSPTISDTPVLQHQPRTSSTRATLQHVTAVQESVCDKTKWHIARLPKTSAKTCFAR